jgi:hypothetical protein
MDDSWTTSGDLHSLISQWANLRGFILDSFDYQTHARSHRIRGQCRFHCRNGFYAVFAVELDDRRVDCSIEERRDHVFGMLELGFQHATVHGPGNTKYVNVDGNSFFPKVSPSHPDAQKTFKPVWLNEALFDGSYYESQYLSGYDNRYFESVVENFRVSPSLVGPTSSNAGGPAFRAITKADIESIPSHEDIIAQYRALMALNVPMDVEKVRNDLGLSPPKPPEPVDPKPLVRDPNAPRRRIIRRAK